MKPFLFLGVRPEDVAADDEYAAMLRCAGLDEPDLRRHRLERRQSFRQSMKYFILKVITGQMASSVRAPVSTSPGIISIRQSLRMFSYAK